MAASPASTGHCSTAPSFYRATLHSPGSLGTSLSDRVSQGVCHCRRQPLFDGLFHVSASQEVVGQSQALAHSAFHQAAFDGVEQWGRHSHQRAEYRAQSAMASLPARSTVRRQMHVVCCSFFLISRASPKLDLYRRSPSLKWYRTSSGVRYKHFH